MTSFGYNTLGFGSYTSRGVPASYLVIAGGGEVSVVVAQELGVIEIHLLQKILEEELLLKRHLQQAQVFPTQ